MAYNKDNTEHKKQLEKANSDVNEQVLREKEEPKVRMNALPIFIVVFISVLFAWAGSYMSEYKGDFAWHIYDERGLDSTVAMGPVVFDPMKAGEKFFKKNCALCHQIDGKGLPGAFPPLAGSDWVKDKPERLIKILLHGMTGEITVNGLKFNGNMPVFKAEKDRDIAAVLTYIRSNTEWGNAAGSVSEELVKKIREETKDQLGNWNGSDLQPKL